MLLKNAILSAGALLLAGAAANAQSSTATGSQSAGPSSQGTCTLAAVRSFTFRFATLVPHPLSCMPDPSGLVFRPMLGSVATVHTAPGPAPPSHALAARVRSLRRRALPAGHASHTSVRLVCKVGLNQALILGAAQRVDHFDCTDSAGVESLCELEGVRFLRPRLQSRSVAERFLDCPLAGRLGLRDVRRRRRGRFKQRFDMRGAWWTHAWRLVRVRAPSAIFCSADYACDWSSSNACDNLDLGEWNQNLHIVSVLCVSANCPSATYVAPS